MKKINRRNFFSKFLAVFGITAVTSKSVLSDEEIAKAWEDPEYRDSLTDEQWNSLPNNPAGDIENGQYSGNLSASTTNYCSGNNCSGNNCSGNNCSGNSCSGNNCSGNNCSGNNCSGNSCSSWPCGG